MLQNGRQSVYMGPDDIECIDSAWEDQVLVLPKGVHAKTKGRSQREWGPSPSDGRLATMSRGELRGHFGATIGLCGRLCVVCGHFSILWGHFGVTLGSFWSHYAITLEILWAYEGDFGSLSAHFGITLGPLLAYAGYFGITLGLLSVTSSI